MRSSREFMMRVLVEMLIKKGWNIRLRAAEGGDPTALAKDYDLF